PASSKYTPGLPCAPASPGYLEKVEVERKDSQPVVHDHRISGKKHGLGDGHLPRLRCMDRSAGERREIDPSVRRPSLPIQDPAPPEIASAGYSIQRHPKLARPQAVWRHRIKDRAQLGLLFLGTSRLFLVRFDELMLDLEPFCRIAALSDHNARPAAHRVAAWLGHEHGQLLRPYRFVQIHAEQATPVVGLVGSSP